MTKTANYEGTYTRMKYEVGEKIIYPHHGAAVIEDIQQRTVKGEEVDYLVLKIHQSDLTVMVPAKNAELVGVRDVVGEEGLLKVFSVLREIDVEEAGNWSRRYKANQERLASGDVNKVAEVVRDLWRRDQDRGLSAGEKRMLAKARQILVGELALAESVDEKKVETFNIEIEAIIARQAVGKPVASPDTEAQLPAKVDLDDFGFDDDDDDDDF